VERKEDGELKVQQMPEQTQGKEGQDSPLLQTKTSAASGSQDSRGRNTPSKKLTNSSLPFNWHLNQNTTNQQQNKTPQLTLKPDSLLLLQN